MIFSKTTSLNFSGLRKIQYDLDQLYPAAFPADCLVITASLPSLKAEEKVELIQAIRQNDRIIFWCYGDLLWNIPFWQSIENELKGKKITWVVASKRWLKLAEQFIPSENISLIAHPFNLNTPSLSRSDARLKFGWHDDDKVLLYCGRRSQQKNLPRFWHIWKELRLKSPTPVKLVLVGDWCDYGIPQSPENKQPISIQKRMWDELRSMFQEDLLDFGQIDHDKLPDILLAADVAVSFSTFLEEDFGLALREARLVGTPVVSTNWGGHADMKDEGTFLVAVDEAGFFEDQEALAAIKNAFLTQRKAYDYRGPIQPDLFKLNTFHGFPKKNQMLQSEWRRIMSGLDH